MVSSLDRHISAHARHSHSLWEEALLMQRLLSLAVRLSSTSAAHTSLTLSKYMRSALLGSLGSRRDCAIQLVSLSISAMPDTPIAATGSTPFMALQEMDRNTHQWLRVRPGGCFTNISRALQNILSKFVYCRNRTSNENFKLKRCTCAQSHALGTHTKF